jgi:DNA invertase Pin-like site-specific DNA recombinase
MSTKAAILCRVSTRDQAVEGNSLDQQEAFCRVYAKRHGMTVVKVYSAQESSLATDRIEQSKALADAEAGNFKILIVQDLSRFTSDMLNGLKAAERLKNAGVGLHATTVGPVDIETPQGQYLFATLTGARGVHLRDHINSSIRERIKIMNDEKRPAAGRPPWGRIWDSKTHCFRVIPKKRAVLHEVYKLIVQQDITHNKTAASCHMPSSSLRKAIQQSNIVEVTQRLGGKSYKFKCEPILTDIQRTQIETAIMSNAIVRHRTKRAYLLQGLVRCAGCGATMTGQTSTKDGGKSYVLYRHPPGKRFKVGCTWHVPSPLLDDDVLRACALAVSDGAQLRQAIENALAQANSAQPKLRERRQFLLGEIKSTEARFERILDRLVAFDEGTEARKRLETRAKADEMRLVKLKDELAEVDRQIALTAISDTAADMAATKMRSLYWQGIGPVVLSFEQQRDFVRTMIGRIGHVSPQGIYVSKNRATGATKKDVTWQYQLRGSLMLASSHVGRHLDVSPAPLFSGDATTSAVRRLANIAAASPGITPPHRPYKAQLKKGMQMRMKPSSDD